MRNIGIKILSRARVILIMILIISVVTACVPSAKNNVSEIEDDETISASENPISEEQESNLAASDNQLQAETNEADPSNLDEDNQKKDGREEEMEELTLTSSFKNEENIPSKYAYFGVKGAENISLPLEWSGLPKDTKSIAILLYDLHPIADEWVHWAVVNISPTSENINEGASNTDDMPKGSTELVNSYGENGYGGPCPPEGSGAHEYKIILYALNVDNVDLSGEVTAEQFQSELEDKIIDKAELSGYFEQ